MSYDPHSHLQGISAFVHTVETGSFTAAAARMGLTKSAVGKSVTRLEERLGARLLHRTTRSHALTAEGQAYYASCLKVLDELGSAEALLASRHEEVGGKLRVNLPFSFGRLWAMPVLFKLARQYPQLSLEVTFADRLVDLADEGIDLAVRIGDPGDQASLIGRRIATQRWMVCASPAYIDKNGLPGTFEDLDQHACIVFARDGRYAPWLVQNPTGGIVEVRVKPRHIVCHGEALRDATLAGMGVANLTTWLVGRDLQAGRLRPVLMKQPVDGSPIYALWHASRDPAPKIRAAVDALVEAFSLPPWDSAYAVEESA